MCSCLPADVATSGKPEEYADLYGFVRANAEYLDGYEEAAVAGPGLTRRSLRRLAAATRSIRDTMRTALSVHCPGNQRSC